MSSDPAKRVSMAKTPGDKTSGSKASGSRSAGSTDDSTEVRPRPVQAAVVALVISALTGILAAVTLFGQRAWLTSEQVKLNVKSINSSVSSAASEAAKQHGDVAKASASASAAAASKYPTTAPALHSKISQQQSGALIMSLVLALAIGLIAFSVYRGRHWSRWGVVGFWFLASFTGTFAGLSYLLAIGSSSLPAAFKIPAFLSAAALAVAVGLVNLRPSTEYFAAHKPGPAIGGGRRGAFAPRTPRTPPENAQRGKNPLTSNAASRGEAYVDRQRAKKRAATNAASVARGAELARSRAKASKSRRTDS